MVAPEELEALLDHAQDTIVVLDESGTYRYANQAAERILGFPPSTIVGENAFDHIHPDDRERVRTLYRELIARDEPTVETTEFRQRSAAGEWVWLESRVSNSFVEDLDGYVVSSRDITDRKRAERREQRTETRLRELAASAEDVLWMFTGDWSELVFVNDAYEEIWGQDLERLREEPTHFLQGIHPDDRDRVRAAMERISAGEALDIEYRVNPTLDYRRWVWVKARPIRDDDGEVTHVVGFSRDITDRRRRERQLRVMDNLLRHNIRNDMNVILGHARRAAEADAGSVEESMAVITETGEGLLRTAAKEREIIELLVGVDDRTTVDVVAAIEKTVEAFRSTHPAATVRLDAPDSAEVVAVTELHHAFEEFLENAAEHSEAAPEIELTVGRTDRTVTVEIADNAPPIPGNEFEPLIEASEPSDLNHGTGLGLWLAYWIVDLSDGDLSFDRHDDGNLVTISLPRADG